MNPPYKDAQKRWRTQSLFKETNFKSDMPSVFTLKEFDYYDDKQDKVLPSIRRLFLEYSDPTAYRFAKAVLGSYTHWEKLINLPWFSDHVDRWMAELEVKLQSDGIQKIKDIASSDSGQALQAAKYLADKSLSPKKAGRPKKEAKQESLSEDELEDDWKRMQSE